MINFSLRKLSVGIVAVLLGINLFGQPFYLPTPSTSIFDLRGQENYFVATPGRTWESGTFGCVRSDGLQMHEGIDIRCVQRDNFGNPIDPIFATADGMVVYINDKEALSNYGKYIIIRHVIDGIEVYSLYAHLSQIRSGLKPGSTVRAGDRIGVMGTTANTRQRISSDRAHLHFEINLFLNDKFPYWFKARYPTERNDHGVWNGMNLAGLDPRMIFLLQKRQGTNFNLVQYIQNQTELFRVFTRKKDFSFLKRYPALIVRNPKVAQEGLAGYEISLNFNGVPIRLIERTPSETKNYSSLELLYVNADEQKKNPCRKFVSRKGSGWELTNYGLSYIELLTY